MLEPELPQREQELPVRCFVVDLSDHNRPAILVIVPLELTSQRRVPALNACQILRVRRSDFPTRRQDPVRVAAVPTLAVVPRPEPPVKVS